MCVICPLTNSCTFNACETLTEAQNHVLYNQGDVTRFRVYLIQLTISIFIHDVHVNVSADMKLLFCGDNMFQCIMFLQKCLFKIWEMVTFGILSFAGQFICISLGSQPAMTDLRLTYCHLQGRNCQSFILHSYLNHFMLFPSQRFQDNNNIFHVDGIIRPPTSPDQHLATGCCHVYTVHIQIPH